MAEIVVSITKKIDLTFKVPDSVKDELQKKLTISGVEEIMNNYKCIYEEPGLGVFVEGVAIDGVYTPAMTFINNN